MDFRKTFDKIPESFDKYRPRYCDELFEELIIMLRPSQPDLQLT